MKSDFDRASADWLASRRITLVAWWLPEAAIVAALFAAVPLRTVLWTLALMWMGIACILNARRCGRTHCRYTGPYYLSMIVPALAFGTGLVSLDTYGWVTLAVLIVAGGRALWWVTERVWGKFL